MSEKAAPPSLRKQRKAPELADKNITVAMIMEALESWMKSVGSRDVAYLLRDLKSVSQGC